MKRTPHKISGPPQPTKAAADLPDWMQNWKTSQAPTNTDAAAQASDLDQLMTMNEVATLLRLSRRTVARMVKNGQIPSIKLGHSVRILRQQLLDTICNIRE